MELDAQPARSDAARADELEALANVGTWSLEVATWTTWWSPRMRLLLGLSPTDDPLDAEGYAALIHPDDRPWVVADVRDLLERGVAMDARHRLLLPDGTRRVVRAVGRGERGEDGSLRRVHGMTQDVTDAVAIEEALRAGEERHRTVLRHLPDDTVTLFDRKLRFVLSEGSRNAERGWTTDAVRGQHISDVYPPAWLEGLLGVVEAARDGTPQALTWHSSQDATTHAIEVVPYRPDPDGPAAGVLMISRDVTVRHRLEEAARAAERRHREELERSARELERSNAELERFASVASHDLQEPLRSVASFTGLVRSRYAGRLDDQADEYLRLAADGAVRMQALIRDLLAISRVGLDRLTPQEVALDDVVRRALTDLSEAVEASGADVHVGPLPRVRADPSLLALVFQNLIGNAIKFAGERAPRVAITAEKEPEGWRVTCTDRGIGIAPKHAERIFTIFQRLHTVSEYPGTGMGLAMCRKVVEVHGGRIWLDAGHDGPGASFAFTLPA